MSMKSQKNKCSLTTRIDSNKLENGLINKKRKHLTIQSDTNTETIDCNWNPPNWNKTLEAIRQMRKDIVAPVDDMGCDQAADSNIPPEVYKLNL